ncbi:MAG: DUF4174 domain-containing protein [Rhodobacteraceae bacterium]|nr:DUF4174 domain-containing protein [Paracoccaceae bacterium]
MKLFRTLVFAAILPVPALAADTPATDPAPDKENVNAAAAGPATAPDATADDAATDGADDAAALPDPDVELLFLDAREIDVREFIWERRIVVVMADTPNDPLLLRQLQALRERADDFVERDVVVIFDGHPEDNSPLRQVMRPRGFMTAIIDKDGEVKARRPAPRTGRELMAVIDRFPLRRQEVLERLPSGR